MFVTIYLDLESEPAGAKARVDSVRFIAGDESPAYRPNEFFSKL
jgi:hypothetical protein